MLYLNHILSSLQINIYSYFRSIGTKSLIKQLAKVFNVIIEVIINIFCH